MRWKRLDAAAAARSLSSGFLFCLRLLGDACLRGGARRNGRKSKVRTS